jgi:hypothetical protein
VRPYDIEMQIDDAIDGLVDSIEKLNAALAGDPPKPAESPALLAARFAWLGPEMQERIQRRLVARAARLGRARHVAEVRA